MRLSEEQIRTELNDLPGWQRRGEVLEKTFDRGSFRGAISFVNTLSELAERAEHHPDLDIRYRHVRVGLTTHDEGGLTDKDVALARQVEAVSRE